MKTESLLGTSHTDLQCSARESFLRRPTGSLFLGQKALSLQREGRYTLITGRGMNGWPRAYFQSAFSVSSSPQSCPPILVPSSLEPFLSKPLPSICHPHLPLSKIQLPDGSCARLASPPLEHTQLSGSHLLPPAVVMSTCAPIIPTTRYRVPKWQKQRFIHDEQTS